ncbi:MAG: hypothetical protein PHD61_11800 [Bacteroidales bacterium]|nr:hypothetical protein [Lentimicrobiaceae bacterium]MDD5695972.1 hypothetical protein [Bacteroidales bacterium]
MHYLKIRTLRQQLFILLILLVTFFTVNFGFYSSRQAFIDGDGNGYYAYLPAIFIYHTIDFGKFTQQSPLADEKYHQPHYLIRQGEVLINKYTCGTALLQAPLFLSAMAVARLSGQGPDGYSAVFQYSVALTALLCLFLGLLFLKKLLQTYHLSEKAILIILLAGLFATNLFFYAFIQPSLSHVYSFFAITLFSLFARKALSQRKARDLFIAAFALGLVVLIRPVNILVVAAVPFLAGVPHPLRQQISNANLTTEARRGIHRGAQRIKIPDMLKASLIFLLVISPQLIILILQTGDPFQRPYPGEGFEFIHPHILDFLFSYRKGWFIYTPFMLLLIPGGMALYQKSRFEFVAFFCFLFFLIYFFSAWWNWFYGNGFGMRPMVDYYGLFLIPIGIFFGRLERTGKWIVIPFILLAGGLNLVQSYQYSRGILHADSMNRSAYWYTFLKTGVQYENVIGPGKETVYGVLSETPILSVIHDFEQNDPKWIKLQDADTGKAYSGNYLLQLDSSHAYSHGYPLVINDSLAGRDDLYVDFSVHYFEPTENSAAGSVFVADVLDSQYHSLYYRNFKLKSVPDRITGQWRQAETGFRLPVLYDDAVQIRFYIWNKDRQFFFLDDMGIRLYEILID